MQQNYADIKTSKHFSELTKYYNIAAGFKKNFFNINFQLNNLINLSAKQDFLPNSTAEIDFVPENSITVENSKLNEDLIMALQKLRVTPSWWNPWGKPYQSTDPSVLSDVLIAILNYPIANNNTDLINNFANNKIYNKEVLSNALAKLSLNPQSTTTANNIIKIIINNNDISMYEKYQLISSYLNSNLTKEFYDDIILYVKTQNWPSDDISNLCELLAVETEIKEQANNLKIIVNNNSNENQQTIIQKIIDLKLSILIQQPVWKTAIKPLINNSDNDISSLLNIHPSKLISTTQIYKDLLQNELNYITKISELLNEEFYTFSTSITTIKNNNHYSKQKTWLTFNSLISQIQQQLRSYSFEHLKSVKQLYLSDHKKLLTQETNRTIYMLITDFLKQPDSIDKLSDIEQNLDSWFLLNYDSNNTLKQQIKDYKTNILQEINNLRTKHQNTSDAPTSPQQDCDSIAFEIFKLLLNKNPNKSQFLLKLNDFLRPCFATGETNCSFDETKLNSIITEINYSTIIEKSNTIQVVNNVKQLLEAEKNKLANTKKAAEEIAEQTYSKLPTPITESSIEAILQNKLDIPNKYNNLEIDPEFFLEIHNEYFKNKLTLLKQQMQLQEQALLTKDSLGNIEDIIKEIQNCNDFNILQQIVNSTTDQINNNHITLTEHQKNNISTAIKEKINLFVSSTNNNHQLVALHNCFNTIQNNNLLVTLTDHENILNVRRQQAKINSRRNR